MANFCYVLDFLQFNWLKLVSRWPKSKLLNKKRICRPFLGFNRSSRDFGSPFIFFYLPPIKWSSTARFDEMTMLKNKLYTRWPATVCFWPAADRMFVEWIPYVRCRYEVQLGIAAFLFLALSLTAVLMVSSIVRMLRLAHDKCDPGNGVVWVVVFGSVKKCKILMKIAFIAWKWFVHFEK